MKKSKRKNSFEDNSNYVPIAGTRSNFGDIVTKAQQDKAQAAVDNKNRVPGTKQKRGTLRPKRKNESSPTRRKEKRIQDLMKGSQLGKQNMPDDPGDDRSIATFVKGLDKGERRAFLAPGRFGGVKGLAIHRGRGTKRFKRKLGIKVQDSIELFGNIIFETFAGLDKATREKRAKKVTKGLERKKKIEKVTPKIKPGGEEAAAKKLDMLGQHALAAGARGGAFTDKYPNKPSAAQRYAKHFQKRGAKGEHDVRLAKGLEKKEKQNEGITRKEKKEIERKSKGDVAKKHELLKKRIDRAIAARKDEARGKYASKRYYKAYHGPFSDKNMPQKGEGPRVDRSTYKKHMKFQAKRQDKIDKGEITPKK